MAVLHDPISPATDSYGWRSAAATCSQPYVLPAMRSALSACGARRVLDIGCGNGALGAQLQADGYEVTGVEADAAGVAIARAAHPGVRVVHGSVEDDPRRLLDGRAPFDAVISTEVIEHLYSPHLLPRFAAAVLRPEGRLILTTPYHGYLKNLALSLFDKWDHHHTALWHGGHIKFWSRATLTQLLRDNGFDVAGFHGIGRVPFLWKSMLMVAMPTPPSAAAGPR